MKKQILFATSIALSLSIHAQTINTVAGNGVGGYSGDGVAATAAELNNPYGVAVDGPGNVYIADNQNNRIRKVNTSGVISTFAGNGTGSYSGDGGAATAAELYWPTGVTVDGSGNVYIADWLNERIRKVNTSGIISTFAGNGTGSYSGDGGAATAAELQSPVGMSVDGSGNVYIADDGNYRIRKVNTSGIISTIAGNGTQGYSGDGEAATSAELYSPTGVAIDGSGNEYIVDGGNNRIRKVNTSGVISTFAGNGFYGFGGDGGAATAAELFEPYGVAVDGSGNVYIADQNNNCIRKVNTLGIISTIAGNSTAGYSGDGGAATSAELNYPSGVAITASGNLYINDGGNSRIREVSGEDVGIGIVRGNSAEVVVYPNPATNQITISAGQPISNIAITNLLGQSVFSNQYNATQVQVDVADLPAGVYIIRINGSEVRKFVKQ